MFKRSRIRIIAVTMTALLLFLIITIAVIYGSSFYQIQKENRELLSEFSERFSVTEAASAPDFGGEPPEGYDKEGFIKPPETEPEEKSPDPKDRDRNRAFEVSAFYYAAISGSGEVLASEAGAGSLFTETSLEELALELLESGETSGSRDGLIYQVTDKEGYSLVAFMDNSIARDNMNTLLRNTLISFAISVIVVFLLSLILSKRIIAPLEENDRRQKQFISDAGHELKTPLAVMSANCELLSKELGENPWLDNIQYENERMEMLVKDLLDLSRAESGTLQEESVNLSELVMGEALPFESIAFEKGLMLEINVDDGITSKGNPAQLRQLAAILIDNAISHSEGGKDVTVSLKCDKHNAILSAANYGKAIPEDKQELLFERFYRMDEARTGDDGHYGLGLAIAKAITQAHGGSISISCGDGKVTFSASLPIR